ncbi:MAG: DinB family protein [Acidobacteria bacterium]|nr:DinB family protein [Acidobacteriota bacterium]
MNKEALLNVRQYFDMVHGVTVRAIGGFSDDELNYRPRPDMRSAGELIYHLYGMEKVLALGLSQGRLSQETENLALPESAAGATCLATLNTVAKMQAYARECHTTAQKTLEAMSDDELTKIIESPFGSFPAWQYFAFAYDEHWHHRGQLYTYLRLLGKEPLMLYDYQTSPA